MHKFCNILRIGVMVNVVEENCYSNKWRLLCKLSIFFFLNSIIFNVEQNDCPRLVPVENYRSYQQLTRGTLSTEVKVMKLGC